MHFDSYHFLFFFPTACAVYFLLPHRFRWQWLLFSSCLFYMDFIPAYLLILFVTIVIDYAAAIWIERSTGKRRKAFLILSILSTCGVLVVFKYLGFFSRNASAIAHLLRLPEPSLISSLILPVGLSFHTFQSLSYVIEVYRGNQKAERHFGIYALYVMFFPQLVAGPIERPQNLLHQFRETHVWNSQRVKDGLLLMVVGFLKKVVVADRLAIFVNPIFQHPRLYSGLPLIFATVSFAFQIYYDFSGYSDIARGAARVLGFELMVNFDHPYSAASVSEFWKRWHISLSTWFKDYLYIPLGGNRVAIGRWYFNLLVTFLVSGLWHGANWTFMAWGGLNGVFLVLEIVTGKLRTRVCEALGISSSTGLLRVLGRTYAFTLICFAWIFFRASSFGDAFYIIRHLFDFRWTNNIFMLDSPFLEEICILLLISVTLFGLRMMAKGHRLIELFGTERTWSRWALYFASLLTLLFLSPSSTQPFIYFQF